LNLPVTPSLTKRKRYINPSPHYKAAKSPNMFNPILKDILLAVIVVALFAYLHVPAQHRRHWIFKAVDEFVEKLRETELSRRRVTKVADPKKYSTSKTKVPKRSNRKEKAEYGKDASKEGEPQDRNGKEGTTTQQPIGTSAEDQAWFEEQSL